jgi:hypothetical protein
MFEIRNLREPRELSQPNQQVMVGERGFEPPTPWSGTMKLQLPVLYLVSLREQRTCFSLAQLYRSCTDNSHNVHWGRARQPEVNLQSCPTKAHVLFRTLSHPILMFPRDDGSGPAILPRILDTEFLAKVKKRYKDFSPTLASRVLKSRRGPCE